MPKQINSYALLAALHDVLNELIDSITLPNINITSSTLLATISEGIKTLEKMFAVCSIDLPAIPLIGIAYITHELKNYILEKNNPWLNIFFGSVANEIADLNESLKNKNIDVSLNRPDYISEDNFQKNGLLLSTEQLISLERKPNTSIKLGFYRVVIDNNLNAYIFLKSLGAGFFGAVSLAQRILFKNGNVINGGWVATKEEFENHPAKIIDECRLLYQANNLVGIATLEDGKIISFQKYYEPYKPRNMHNSLSELLELAIKLLNEIRHLDLDCNFAYLDLHNGNIIYEKDKKIHLIDFGLCEPLSEGLTSWYWQKISDFSFVRWLSEELDYYTDMNLHHTAALATKMLNVLKTCTTPGLTFNDLPLLTWLTNIKNALDQSLPNEKIIPIIDTLQNDGILHKLSRLPAALFYPLMSSNLNNTPVIEPLKNTPKLQ